MSLLRRPGRPDADGRLVGVKPGEDDWRFVYFDAYRLDAGRRLEGNTAGTEAALIVLGGRCTVEAGAERFAGIGERPDVWAKTAPYVVLLPPGTPYNVRAEGALHLAMARAEARTGVPIRLIAPADIKVEHRGEGQTARQVHHLLPSAASAERLILFEVYSPGGNWSSFPPHKHDTQDPPRESYLEELYYMGVNPPSGFALQRIYTPDRSLDEALAPMDGDLVLVPRGYHVVSASPGHDNYYLNAMAGLDRDWSFTFDPDYAAQATWAKPAAAEGQR